MVLPASRKKPSIGLTPLIDVVFILLIFFMLVMQFQQFQQNNINIKKSAPLSSINQQTEKVRVDKNNQCEWKQQLFTCEQVIEQFLANNKKGQSVLLGYSDDVTLQQLMLWHDRFIERGLQTSLAVQHKSQFYRKKVTEGGR